ASSVRGLKPAIPSNTRPASRTSVGRRSPRCRVSYQRQRVALACSWRSFCRRTSSSCASFPSNNPLSKSFRFISPPVIRLSLCPWDIPDDLLPRPSMSEYRKKLHRPRLDAVLRLGELWHHCRGDARLFGSRMDPPSPDERNINIIRIYCMGHEAAAHV